MRLTNIAAQLALSLVLALTTTLGPALALDGEEVPAGEENVALTGAEAAVPLEAEDTSENRGMAGSAGTVESPVGRWMLDAERDAEGEIADAMSARRQALARGERVSALPPEFTIRNRIDKELLANFDGLGRPLTGYEQFARNNLQRYDGLLGVTMCDEVADAEAPQTRHKLLQLLAARGPEGEYVDPYTQSSAEWLYWQCYGSPWVSYTSALASREGSGGPASRFAQQMREREISTYQGYGANELSAHFGEQSEASRLFDRYRQQVRQLQDAQRAEDRWQRASFWSDPLEYWSARRGRQDLEALNQERSRIEQEFLQRAYLPGQDRRAGD